MEPHTTLEKIQKLRKRKDFSSHIDNLQELETFLVEACKIVNTLNLETDLGPIIQTSREERLKYGENPDDGTWEKDLLDLISKYTYCYSVYHPLNKTITLIGKRENLQILRYLYDASKTVTKELVSKDYRDQVTKIREKYLMEGDSVEHSIVFGIEKYGLSQKQLKNNVIKRKDGNYYIIDVQKAKLLGYRDTYMRSSLKVMVTSLIKKLESETSLKQKEVTDYHKRNYLEISNFIKINYPHVKMNL